MGEIIPSTTRAAAFVLQLLSSVLSARKSHVAEWGLVTGGIAEPTIINQAVAINLDATGIPHVFVPPLLALIDSSSARPPEERPSAFFNAWTRKEAFVKAVGKGFSLPVNQVEVSLEPGAPARLLAAPAGHGPVPRWSMAALEPPSGFAGALVVEGQGWSLEFFEAPCMVRHA
jgi:hypothetical protein